MTLLPVDDFLLKGESLPVIDVRSPREFERGHIPGAHSVSLFDNDERATVGITYKQIGKETAMDIGFRIAEMKIENILKSVYEIAPLKKILVYCWRGGMRSKNVAELLEKNGFHASVLIHGYKAYRNILMESFAKQANIIVLGGMTGSGKTEILKELAKRREQVLDIECIACHKGSAFGALGQNPQPATQQFQNELFSRWRKFDLKKPVWIEDESLSVGTVCLPQPLYFQMRNAPVIHIEMDRKTRTERLVKEYAGFDKEQLKAVFQKIKQSLGGQNVKTAIEAIDKGDFFTSAEISLRYYDMAYQHGLSQRKKESIFGFIAETDVAATNAKKVVNLYKAIKKDE